MFKGKVQLKGIFLSIDTYHCDKAKFVQNDLYHQLLPNDIILYNVKDQLVTVHKIIYRKDQITVGILQNESNDWLIFHTPLLSRNYICYIHKKYIKNPNFSLLYGDRYTIKIGRFYNTLLQYYGNIRDRQHDHNILIDLYKSDSTTTYPLDIVQRNEEKEEEKEKEKEKEEGEKEEGKKVVGYTRNDVVDLTHLYTFNIDPKQSKDFDDALSVDVEKKRFYIHIVDANQIDLMSFTEKRMAYLGLTFYTHNENCNILPNILSENKFSLLRDEDRHVITVEITIDDNASFDNGKLTVTSYEIYKSIIRVKERFNYDDVLTCTKPEFTFLQNITEKYYKRRLNIIQPSYQVDTQGNLLSIYYEDMNSWSHRLIEMMMINANRIVTEHMNGLGIVIPQRVHPKPIMELEAVTGDEIIDGIIIIQKYRNASYNHTQNGHYGLNLDYYTHFTSPIRRYNDVIVMRIMNGYQYNNMENLLEHINHREDLNSVFEKLYKRWKLLGYLEKCDPNQLWDAYVTNITPHGMKFYIKSLGFDGFLRASHGNGGGINIGDKILLQCNSVCFTSFDDVQWIHIRE